MKSCFFSNLFLRLFFTGACIFFKTTLTEQVTVEWITIYHDTNGNADHSSAIGLDTSGNVYVGGWTNYSPSIDYNDYALVKYNSSGTEQWHVNYDGLSGFDDKIYDIAVTPAGNVYVTGSSFEGIGSWDATTIKYSTTGGLVWLKSYNGPVSFTDQGTVITVDSMENPYVGGYAQGANTSEDFLTLKYNADTPATIVWSPLYDNSGINMTQEHVNDIEADNSGYVYVTGFSGGNGTGNDFATIKYSSTGVSLWTSRFNNPDSSQDYASGIAKDDSGNVYVTGYSVRLASLSDYATVKYDSSGIEKWVKYYDSQGNDDRSTDIALDNNGNPVVTGYRTYSGNTYLFTIKYNHSGDTLWTATYLTTPAFVSSPAQFKVVVDNNDNVCIIGCIYHATTGNDIAVIKYNGSGQEVWAYEYNGPGGNFPVDLAVDQNNFVYFTATVNDSTTGDDILTAKLSAITGLDLKEDNNHHLTVFPNPCNQKTVISFVTNKKTDCRISLTDVYGKLIYVIADEAFSEGTHSLTFDVHTLESGMYLLHFNSGDMDVVKKVVVVK